METVTGFIFLHSKITADGDCNHVIKRSLLPGRTAMTNLDSILKSRDITLLTRVCLVKAMIFPVQFSSVQFSCSIMSDSLWARGQQHARLPSPSPVPKACSNSCSSSWWCYPTISSSAVPFSSCLQSFPTWGSFPMSQLFASGGQSIGVSASASILLMNIQDWFPLGFTCSPKDSQESSPTPQLESIGSLVLSFLYSPTLTSIHDYWKNRSFD